MRISCPNCSADYEVPDSALAKGPRRLRCARCGHQFQAAPAATPPPAMPEPPKEREAIEKPVVDPLGDPPAGEPPSRHNGAPLPQPEALVQARLGNAPASRPASGADRFALAGWLLTLAVLGVAGYAMVAWRADIVAAWPPAQRVYAAIGLV